MKIAVVGCIHGELEKVYEDISARESEGGFKVDLVLVCGDFQAVRNHNDLKCMAVSPKFRQLGSFVKYYNGTSRAPILTLFIGGNHEASNYLMTLPFGGWVCPNIYYMGYSSVVHYKGLRIGGMSGIYKSYSADFGRFECLPFNESTKRSVYHARRLEAYRFHQLSAGGETKPMDVFMSHDWPVNIHKHGNVKQLLKRKPFFREDITNERLGNPLAMFVLNHLTPRHWFSAHLHVRFEATVSHNNGHTTKFLALDKCLPRRPYLEILDIESTSSDDGQESDSLKYDPEWLAVLKNTNHLQSAERKPPRPTPSFDVRLDCSLDQEIEAVKKLFDDDFTIPTNFTPCKPVETAEDSDPQRLQNYCNAQTTEFCRKLKIDDPASFFVAMKNPEEISVSDSDSEDEADSSQCKKLKADTAELGPKNLFVIDTEGDGRRKL